MLKTTEAYIQEIETHSTKNELYVHKHGVHYSGYEVHRIKPMHLNKEYHTFID